MSTSNFDQRITITSLTMSVHWTPRLGIRKTCRQQSGTSLHRTDPGCSPSEILYAIWICIPASDAIAGRFGDGVEEILGLRNMQVVVMFTKLDVVTSKVRVDSPSESHERMRTRAHTIYEDPCFRLLHKDPKDVPAEIVSRIQDSLISSIT
ncbi:hypothetical protein EDB87DRAFT_1131717 [Lactarius vividus]|nr:hypothetical protein EDB87DRAFT_1131717 [Lactarius vividus]